MLNNIYINIYLSSQLTKNDEVNAKIVLLYAICRNKVIARGASPRGNECGNRREMAPRRCLVDLQNTQNIPSAGINLVCFDRPTKTINYITAYVTLSNFKLIF